MVTAYGPITKIRYYNEENGFGIVFIKLDYRNDDLKNLRDKLFTNILTVTCNFDTKPLIDEEFNFVGDLITTSYGIQLKATNFKRINQSTKEGIIVYLSSDDFYGIGKITASKVYETLGNDCINEIVKDKTSLDKVEGLTVNQKDTIYDTLVFNETNKKAVVELANYGLTVNLSKKIINALGKDSIVLVRENPYQLIEKVEGIGFLKADEIALKIGIQKDSILRIKSLIMYIINITSYQKGDTLINIDDLFDYSYKIINKEEHILTKELFEKAIDSLASDEKIFIDKNNNISDIYIYNAEVNFSKKIIEIMASKQKVEYSLEKINYVLDEVEKANKITYSPLQKEAIIKAIQENVMIITGGPGTGKSTIVKGILQTYMELAKNDMQDDCIALLAPTGRAAKRLKELTMHPNTKTIHKFLGYQGHNKYEFGEDNKVFESFIIVDEFSMVDIVLASRLFSALPDSPKIIIVGDSDQLPSVGPGDLLNNLISSKEITTCKLDKIHRQATNSSIINLAHCLNEGYLPEDILEKKKDRNFLHITDEVIIPSIIKTIEQAQLKNMNLIRDIQVLIPMYKGENGIEHVNKVLQDKFNPNGEELKVFGRNFRVNDKVLQLVNRSEKQIMNGDIGFIMSLDKENDEYVGLTVMYDSFSVSYKKDELEDITLAYAISIHKAQGSEFDLVIIPFTFQYMIMLKRKLIYTAVTRAKKFLIMLGNVRALEKGINGIEESRKTRLVENLKFLLKNTNSNNIMINDKNSAFDEIKENMENLSPYDFLD